MEEGDVFVVEAVPAEDIVLFVDDKDGAEFGLELLKAGEVLVPAVLEEEGLVEAVLVGVEEVAVLVAAFVDIVDAFEEVEVLDVDTDVSFPCLVDDFG